MDSTTEQPQNQFAKAQQEYYDFLDTENARRAEHVGGWSSDGVKLSQREPTAEEKRMYSERQQRQQQEEAVERTAREDSRKWGEARRELRSQRADFRRNQRRVLVAQRDALKDSGIERRIELATEQNDIDLKQVDLLYDGKQPCELLEFRHREITGLIAELQASETYQIGLLQKQIDTLDAEEQRTPRPSMREIQMGNT